MNIAVLHQLARLIRSERGDLLRNWRAQVRKLPSGRNLDIPTLNDHVPVLLDELAEALESVSDESIPEALLDGSPPIHGQQRFSAGFDIVEVVAEYNILRGCIHDLTESREIPVRGMAFHILNRVLDEAIALAVQTFAAQQALEVQKRREEYLAFVAHDLRTPLNAISLAAKLLEVYISKPGSQDDIAQMLRTIGRSTRQLDSIVQGVLKESANVEAVVGVRLERRHFELWPLVEGLIRDLQPVAETSGTQLVNSIPEELEAYADASLLRRVFQNLIANAIKYTPRGRVTIGARGVGTGGDVECFVKDNGSGIPPDRIDVIFEKGETDPERGDGTGLGLAIVKTFVEAHGGEVMVHSAESIGSTFQFVLPGAGRGT